MMDEDSVRRIGLTGEVYQLDYGRFEDGNYRGNGGGEAAHLAYPGMFGGGNQLHLSCYRRMKEKCQRKRGLKPCGNTETLRPYSCR
jgi:hypothetical protein